MSALSTMAMGIKNYNDKYYARDHYCETVIETDDNIKTAPTINININFNFGEDGKNKIVITEQEKVELTRFAADMAKTVKKYIG